jgi:23S rRNA pseudouridine1911/1915/1917 synthase
LFPDINTLYEDNHLIAVNKAAGELAQGDKTGDTILPENIKAYIKEKFGKPGDVFLGVIHRIDRPVSGVLLFARTSKALERMNKLFNERKVKKIYWAMIDKKPPALEGTLVHFLKKNQEKNMSRAWKKEIPGAKRAELSYKLLAESGGFYLLEIKPDTGRHHQIRVQLSAIGCPIVGDNKYGYKRANPDRSICLHARELHFIHPVKNEPVSIIAPLPDNPLWQKFTDYSRHQRRLTQK